MAQTAIIIISVILFIIILIGLSAGGWFGYKWYSSRDTTTTTDTNGSTTNTNGSTTNTNGGTTGTNGGTTGTNGGTTGTNGGTTGTNGGTTGTNGGTGTTVVDSTEGPIIGYNPVGIDAGTYDWSNLKRGTGVLDTLSKLNGKRYKWDGTPVYKFKFAYSLNDGKMEVTIDGVKSDKIFNIYGNNEGYNVYDMNGNNYSIYYDYNVNKLKVIEDRGTYEMIPV